MSDEIKFIRQKTSIRIRVGTHKEPIKPSRKFRFAMATTKSPYNFLKVKRKRKIAKQSRKRNRK